MILKFHRKAKYDMMISVLDEINRAAIEKRYSFSKMEEPDFKVLEAMRRLKNILKLHGLFHILKDIQ